MGIYTADLQGSRFSYKFRLKVLTIVAYVLEPTAGYKLGYSLTECHLFLSKTLGLIQNLLPYILLLRGENQIFKPVKVGQYSCRILTPPSITDAFMMGLEKTSCASIPSPSNPQIFAPSSSLPWSHVTTKAWYLFLVKNSWIKGAIRVCFHNFQFHYNSAPQSFIEF